VSNPDSPLIVSADEVSPPKPEEALPRPAEALPRCAVRGLFQQRLLWLPSLRGWLVLFIGSAVAGWVLVTGIYPFLAQNRPLPGSPLVVEGWGDDEVLQQGIREIQAGHYHGLFVTGGTISKGAPFSEFHSQAELGAAIIDRLSGGAVRAQAIPTPDVRKDRTFASAVALKEWMAAHGGIPAKITVLSVGPHSRRTRLLFAKAFGDRAEVGILAFPSDGYDPKRWWIYSEGFRNVTSEAIAYAYARIIFWGE
jgi:uncharacterized SAM-binding protein YcdF (DUF218 family)